MTDAPPDPPLGFVPMLRLWLNIGLQSWGGGTATFALIQRTWTQTHPHITEGEFAKLWAMAQLSPGINLLSLTILVGRRIGGRMGIAAALIGLLVPSVTLALAITAAYAYVRDNPTIRAAFAGILPATVGIGLYTALRTARPLLQESRAWGRDALAFDIALIVACIAAVGWAHLPTVVVVLGGGTFSGLFHWARATRTRTSDGGAA